MAERGVLPEQMARDLGTSHRLVQKWRAGTTRPSDANLVAVALYLERPVSWFFEEAA